MDRRSTRILVAIAALGIVAVDALYLAIILLQGGAAPPDVLTVPFIAGYLLLMAALLVVSLRVEPALKPALRAAAACGLLVLGVLAAFSIGILLLGAAVLSIAATAQTIGRERSPRVLGATLVASIASVTVLLGGLQLTWSFIVCPSTGQMSGTTAGLFGQTSYQCIDGRLTKH